MIAICHCELKCFRQRMYVTRGVMSKGFKIEALQHVQSFNKGWTLCPKARFIDLVTAVVSMNRLTGLCSKLREVLGCNQAAMILHIIADTFCNRTSIEIIARRH